MATIDPPESASQMRETATPTLPAADLEQPVRRLGIEHLHRPEKSLSGLCHLPRNKL